MGRGGRRPGAGRPNGARGKKPFGNFPTRPAALPAAPSDLVEVTLEERRSWRDRNADEVHQKAQQWIAELEVKAKAQGDLRLEYELLRLRLAYAEGLPAAKSNEPPSQRRFVIESPGIMTEDQWLAQNAASKLARENPAGEAEPPTADPDDPKLAEAGGGR